MKSMESRLPVNDFYRIHRSYIIRLNKLKKTEEETVSVSKATLPISRLIEIIFSENESTLI